MPAKSDFQYLSSYKDLEAPLGLPEKALRFFAYVLPSSEKYQRFEISNKGGGIRDIAAPHPVLKLIQHRISKKIESLYNPKSYVHGYIPGRSIISNAEKHVGQRWLLRLDIKDFFPSITYVRVRGLFMAPPFYMERNVATLLARLCVLDDMLPQGSPASPIISNLIFSTADRRLRKMASENRCYYSRYCDDIFISSNHRHFPKAIAYRDEEDSVALSESFLDVIEQSGFKVNDSKVSLKGKDNRQVVTGIVVNEKKNVPREFVREVRAMIYGWEKAGDLKSFDKYWKENYANRNREYIEDVSFDQVLRGKLSFIKAVKGEADSTYLSLAKRVAALDPSFSIDPKAVRAHAVEEIIVIGEGKTDQLHMEAALNWFHARGKYSELNIKFKEINYKAGDQELLKEAEYLSRHVQKNLVLCVFDSDVSETVKKAKGSAKLYLDRGNNVFTLVIPSPAFRGESICIEHLYKDSDLKKKDSKGRRLYFVDEFDQKLGFHLKDFGIYRPRPGGKTLIVDSDVVDIRTHKNIALTKNDFASKVISKEPPFNDMDFSGFEPLFDTVKEIYDEFKR